MDFSVPQPFIPSIGSIQGLPDASQVWAIISGPLDALLANISRIEARLDAAMATAALTIRNSIDLSVDFTPEDYNPPKYQHASSVSQESVNQRNDSKVNLLRISDPMFR